MLFLINQCESDMCRFCKIAECPRTGLCMLIVSQYIIEVLHVLTMPSS